MRSPLKEYVSVLNSLSEIKKLIPSDSFVHTTGLYAGELELRLAADRRMVSAHSSNWLIYEFWKAIQNNAHKVAQIALDLAPIPTPFMFKCYQEDWPWYDGTDQRAALTFLLNRHSSMNMASAGELQADKFEFHYITQLSKMRLDKLPFDVAYHQVDNTELLLKETAEETRKYKNGYMLVNMRKYVHDYYADINPKGYDMEFYNHKKTCDFLQSTKDVRWIVVYKNSGAIRRMYADHNIIMVNKYGLPTTDISQCEDMIIANF